MRMDNVSRVMKITTNTQFILATLSLIGVLVILLSTSLYGVGISPDSTNYIAAARSLLLGKGYLNFTGSPFVNWPPLFPTLLALSGLVGINPLDGARFLNAFVFGLIIFTSGQLFLAHIRSRTLAILGTVSILLSAPLFAASVRAWSDPLFILLIVLFFMYLPRFLNEKRLVLLFFLSVLAALSCLQRYGGVTIILTGFALIIAPVLRVPLLDRLKYAAFFAVISVSPLAIWIARNYSLTSTLTGIRPPSPYPLYQNVGYSLDVLTSWFLPPIIPFSIRMTGFGLFVSLIVILALLSYEHRAADVDLVRVWSTGVFVLIFTIYLIASATVVRLDPIDDRLLSPIYVFVMLLVFIGIESASNGLNELLRSNMLGKSVVIGLIALWLMYPLARFSIYVWTSTATGAGGYSTVTWRESPLIEWLRTHPLDGEIYSNAPDAIYILTGRTAQFSPGRNQIGIVAQSPSQYQYVSQFRKSLKSEANNYLVWFYNMPRDYLYNVRELALDFEVEEITKISDGEIYTIK
jgi:hypothetical protein